MKPGSPRMGIGTRIRGRLGGFRTPGLGVGLPWRNPIQDAIDLYNGIRYGKRPDQWDDSLYQGWMGRWVPHDKNGCPIIADRGSPGRMRSATTRRRQAKLA